MKLVNIVLGTILLVVVAAILFPLQTGHPPSPSTADISNMKELSFGLMLYSSDHDERLPLSSDWMDQTEKYVKNKHGMRCYVLPQDSPKDSYGHVMERSMPGRFLLDLPEPTSEVMLFDGIKFERNATDSLLGIDFSRHPKPGAALAFADGHAKMYRPLLSKP